MMNKVGRKPKEVTPETDNEDFVYLDHYFSRNEEKNLLIETLNELSPVDRNLIIDLVKCKTLRAMAQELNCSQQVLRKKIKEIRIKFKNNYNQKLNNNE